MLTESTMNCDNMHKNSQRNFEKGLMYVLKNYYMQTYNDRRTVFIVTRPYRSHAATKLSYCHLLLLQCQVCQVGSYLWKFEKNKTLGRLLVTDKE